MTAALLLAMHGRKVIVVEKGSRLGGSMLRYRREGVPFDTGFHFTGGFAGNRLLHDMLSVLRMRDAIQPIYLTGEHCNQFIIESLGRTFDMPCGIGAMKASLKRDFPGESAAIDGFLDRVVKVCEGTASMDLAAIAVSPVMLAEDTITLQEVLDGLTGNAALKSLLSALCMCYGTRPNEVSFANHSRMCLGLYESIARVEGGGEAFAKAFQRRFRELGIEVRCGRFIAGAADIRNQQVGRFVLNDGEEIAFKSCVFTIHPRSILGALPRELLTRAFVERVEAFESSAGFFAVFGVCDEAAAEADFGARIVSLFPDVDVNRLLDPRNHGDSALVIIRSRETVQGRSVPVVCAFEPSFPEQVAAWADSRTGQRPPAYLEYKRRKAERIRERIEGESPGYRGHFRVLDSASILTFRDYLHSPDGSAYGVKQKVGQFNLVGRLPALNCYAAGQSAILPGFVGAMLSSFVVVRAILGKESFHGFVSRGMS